VPGIKVELASDGVGVIPIGLFKQKAVPELGRISKESEPVWCPLPALQARAVFHPVLRLTVQIQRDVSQSHVLLQLRPMSAPFAQALAQDEAVVGETENELEAMIFGEG